jgi:hypothetical protein
MTGAVGTTRLAVDAFKRAGADNDVDTVDPVSSRQSPEPRSHHRTNGVKVRCRKQGDLLRPTCGLYRHDPRPRRRVWCSTATGTQSRLHRTGAAGE